MLDKRIELFVRGLAGDTRHSGRSFFSHLKGTYDLLERDGAAPHVCIAGLCHSIYGTNIFNHASVPLQERQHVANVIGLGAEFLAYTFCSCNRPSALIEAAERGRPYWVLNRHNGQMISLEPVMLCDLLQIEQANMQEQGSVRILPHIAGAILKVSDDGHS